MTAIDNEIVIRYLDSVVDKVFKILPLYEENNATVSEYTESLILQLRGFVSEYGSVGMIEYIEVISTLEGMRELLEEKGNQPAVKREIFKCIDIVKKVKNMLEGV